MADDRPGVPGNPTSAEPTPEEPTTPHPPLPPKPDQSGPRPTTPTGVPSKDSQADQAQQGDWLTSAQGARLVDTDHSLKAGPRGPVLLQDHHLREKITHFDHERIPERVVHARGAAAHGTFVSYGTASNVTKAEFLRKGVETPVFTRFSSVVGSRGSADAVRDTRGFSTKFYTSDGVFDLVGNNIPVFFIQDAVKFPDVVHAAKPQPDREIPQAQSAHDTFWDFVSLHTEATHHTMWQMSDRGIPRSFRTMEGFGIHTFRVENSDGDTSLVKFHWKPTAGVHSLVWEEAQMVNGIDPDFHRRDLADTIEAGAFPEWELGIQVFPDTPEETFEGIDLLDPTKLVPEELVAVQPIGKLSLNRNPSNYFAETEQVAFHPGHLVPGIDVTNDPLFQGRLFSYLDTQISRLGGPNFSQIPINRPHCPVNDLFRDGMHQTAVHTGVAPYKPNTLDGGNPFTADPDDDHTFVEIAQELPKSVKERRSPVSFDDHFTQARMFWLSLTPVEQSHLVDAFTFELGKCWDETIRQREVDVLAAVDAELAQRVASGLGLSPGRPNTPPADDVAASPALSQIGEKWPVDGRRVGIVTGSKTDPKHVVTARDFLVEAGMVPITIAPVGGRVGDVPVERTYLTAASSELDALLLLDGVDADPVVGLLLSEAWRHLKFIAVAGGADALLEEYGVPASDPGIFTGAQVKSLLTKLRTGLEEHRAWSRADS